MSAGHTWSVPEVNEWLTVAIAQALPEDIWIEGEVCNLSRSARGHVYFTLIEPGADRRTATSSLSVTLFDWYRQKVNLALRRAGGAVRMEDGVRVRIRGHVELYQAKGQVQFRMFAIDPAFTLGDLAIQRERILTTLAEEGLLDANARLPMPPVPLRIGLITSLGSAAHADFLHEISESGFGFEIVVVDARVQGVEADLMIAAALEELRHRDVDLVALVRGGGARTDLAAFDSELIARAIAGSPIPIWTGIGHETDRAVADEVAHTSFKTPTACADAIADLVRQSREHAERTWQRIAAIALERLDDQQEAMRSSTRLIALQARARCDDGTHRLRRDAQILQHAARIGTDRAVSHLDHAARSVGPAARRHLDRSASLLTARSTQLDVGPVRIIDRAARDLDARDAMARALDPARTLARGWSVTRRADGGIVRDPDDVTAGDELTTELARGSLRSIVADTDGRRGSDPDG